jgi:predicted glycosyltransferase
MAEKKVLFISGSIGLGHIGRDLQIAKSLREKNPGIDISWLAEDPASRVLVEAGEKILPEAEHLAHGNTELDNSSEQYRANLIKWVLKMRKGWTTNTQLLTEILSREKFDLVVGDETYEIIVEMVNNRSFKTFPFVMIYDFIGVDSVTNNPIDRIAAYMTNRIWARGLMAHPPFAERSLFIGQVEDVPDRRFGFLLPNRRQLAVKSVDFVGYVLSFNPDEYKNKAEIRKLLDYGTGPLIVCSIGGTSAGKNLLDLCSKAYPIMKKEVPNLQMVLVCGPLLAQNSIQASDGIIVKGYVPELFKHLAAADLCIVTGGGTVTLELIALKKPFLYFPLEQHFEQEIDVATRCERFGAGVKMRYSETTPELLAEEALANMGKKVNYPPLPLDGAQNAAEIISQLIPAE